MRQLFIFNDYEEKTNSISIMNYDDFIFIYGDRNQLNELLLNEYINQSGCYFLISENMLYIGQSSKSVLNRLKKHHIEKSWWNKFFIITNKNGSLEKTIVEYVENYFINYYTKNGYTLDNDTMGNTSPINDFTKLNSQRLINKTLFVINEILKLEFKQNKQNINEQFSNKELFITDSNNNTFKGSSLFKLVQAFLSYYAKLDPIYYMNLTHEIDLDDTSLITNKPSSNTVLLVGDLYLNKNANQKKLFRLLNDMISVFNLEIIESNLYE